jgi:hypothetical protein
MTLQPASITRLKLAGAGMAVVELPPLTVTGGHLELEFESDAPPELEAGDPTARRLGFAIDDPVISVSEMPCPSQ